MKKILPREVNYLIAHRVHHEPYLLYEEEEKVIKELGKHGDMRRATVVIGDEIRDACLGRILTFV